MTDRAMGHQKGNAGPAVNVQIHFFYYYFSALFIFGLFFVDVVVVGSIRLVLILMSFRVHLLSPVFSLFLCVVFSPADVPMSAEVPMCRCAVSN